MPRLAEHFEVFAVDLRGQGRSTRTPGRYTLDNMGNDLVRFIDVVIGRPTIVSGLSSGGVLVGVAVGVRQARSGRRGAATRTRRCSRRRCGRRSAPASASRIGPMFDLWSTYLGDQWSIGAWDAMRAAAPERLPAWMAAFPIGDEPRQDLKEYDPEWGRAFWTGTVGRVVRPRADAAQRQGAARAAHPPLPHGRRGHRRAAWARSPTCRPTGCRSSCARPACRSTTARSRRRALDARHRARPLRRHARRLGRASPRREREDRRPRPLPPGLLPGGARCEHGHDQPDGFPYIPEWSADGARRVRWTGSASRRRC